MHWSSKVFALVHWSSKISCQVCWSVVLKLQLLCSNVLKLYIEIPRFLVKCVEALCWGSKFSTLVHWNFTLKSPRVSGQLVCWNFALKFQALYFGALKICVEVPRSLVNLWVEVLRWSSRLMCSCALKLEGLWSGVLKLRVETTRPLIGLLHALRVCIELLHHYCWCFEPFHWSFTSSCQCFKTLCWCFRVSTSYPFRFVEAFYWSSRFMVVLLGLLKLSIEVSWGLWLSRTGCIKAFIITFVCYFTIFFIFLFYKLCLLDLSSWTFII